MDDEDGLMGLPTDTLTSARSENAEIYLPDLGKWLEVRSRYLNWVDGRLAQMVIATDITPRRLAEEQAQRQAERAQSVSRLITMGEMASSVAHELNQPLTAINNYCSGMVSRIQMADTILIEQVLVNLMKNGAEAIQHADRPAPNRSVELRVVPKQIDDRQVVEFSVQDTGKGLAPEVLERLFEAFFSTKQEGMGMGLNLCRSIVESHQGRMQAENLYNGSEVTGCRFSFWLPLAKPADATTNSVANEQNPRTVA